MDLSEQVAGIIAAFPFGRASAVKRGRRSEWPYVPVIDHGEQKTGLVAHRTEQIKGRAFTTREEALVYAARVIEHRRASFAKQFMRPECRALRRQYGLPEEIA